MAVLVCAGDCLRADESSTEAAKPDSEQPALVTPPQAKAPIVWFVHGMVTIRENFDEEMETLRKTWPNAEKVEMKAWNSPRMNPAQMAVAWSDSLENATAFVPQLAKEIVDLPAEQRDRLILVGHSLGARIVVQTSAVCKNKKVQVKKIILAGAAINNDDRDIPAVWAVSRETVENVINFNDALLAAYKVGAEFQSALGTGYLYKTDPQRFREIVMEGTIEHYGYKYLRRYKQALDSGDYSYKGIIVPQDYSNIDFPTLGGNFWWDALDSCHSWRLQHNQATGHCRILDPDDVRRAWGAKASMTAAFEKVRFQLEQNPDLGKRTSSKDIKVIQDLPNWKRSTEGGLVFWNTLEEFEGWKLQQHKYSGHCRILDADDTRQAWGDQEKMKKSFDGVKKQLKERTLDRGIGKEKE